MTTQTTSLHAAQADKLQALKRPNVKSAEAAIAVLEEAGYEMGEVQATFEEWNGLDRADFDDAESYQEEREATWENFIEAIRELETPEADDDEEAAEEPVPEVDAGKGGDWIKGAQQAGYVAPEGVNYEDPDAENSAPSGEDAPEVTPQPKAKGSSAAKAAPLPKKTAKQADKSPIAPKVNCTGLTKAGKPCVMPVIKGTDTCFNHLSAEGKTERGFPVTAAKSSTGPRWSVGTFEEVEFSVKKGTKTLVTGTARVILRREGDKLILSVEA